MVAVTPRWLAFGLFRNPNLPPHFLASFVPALTRRQTGDLPRLAKPAAWLKTRFDIINKTCPQFMRPKYFALVIVTAYKAARKAVVEQCSEFISSGHSFTHDLALAAVQQYGLVKSASINPAKPVPSLAAGLPHFAAGWARCWGRDVVSLCSPHDITFLSCFLIAWSTHASTEHLHTHTMREE